MLLQDQGHSKAMNLFLLYYIHLCLW